MHEFTKYFKEQKGYDRLIDKIYQKYRSISTFSGTIKLENLTKEESLALSRFFGVTYKEGETVKVSVKKFIKVMENSKYTDFDIHILVEEYLNKKLLTSIEEKEILSNEERDYYEEIINANKGIGSDWLKNVITKKENPYKQIQKRYVKNKTALKKELTNILNLVNHLPKQKMLLPIYSSTHTKDPHYLDLDNIHSFLYFHALAYIDKTSYPSTREEKIKLLAKYNIEIDYLSNFAITYNLFSDKEYINKFSENKESLILNIQNIMNTNIFDTSSKKVFIFENPSILSEIIARNVEASVIIASGFPNMSVHLLIEKLIKTNNQLYYNGDFDPEGLLIAEKLKEKYGDSLVLFCYCEMDYTNCISREEINETRLKKLEKVNSTELSKIKTLLQKNKHSAYQENNKDRIINFIKNS